jgi:pentapeptide MXKDX repeat protein
MKKRILSFAVVAAIIGSVAAGCSSANKAGGTDSTSKDTMKTMTDTSKKDTMKPADTTKKDTTKKG